MTNPINHNQAFTDSKVQEMTYGPDKTPNIYAAYLDLRKTLDSKQKVPALTRYEELGGADEPNPIERLRFFCSLAMEGQDWLDVEPFFDEVQKEVDVLQAQLREQHQNQLDLMEKIPTEPEEVYSPHTKGFK